LKSNDGNSRIDSTSGLYSATNIWTLHLDIISWFGCYYWHGQHIIT